MKKLITVIIPAYNEEETLPDITKRLERLSQKVPQYNFEFLFVNDGSRDKTLEILQDFATRDPRISYINLSRNFGKEIGVAAGLDYAQGDAVVIMDADGQEPPELIPTMIQWWDSGGKKVMTMFTPAETRKRTRPSDVLLRTPTIALCNI